MAVAVSYCRVEAASIPRLLCCVRFVVDKATLAGFLLVQMLHAHSHFSRRLSIIFAIDTVVKQRIL